MLTPEQLAQIADTATVRKLYDQLQEDIIADMARRISEMDFASYTTMWELQRLEAINAERDYIVQRLAEATGKSKKEIIAILNTGCSTALSSDDKVYRLAGYNPLPLAQNPALQTLIWAGYSKTLGTFENLTRTTANTATRQFEAALDRAYMQVTSGGMSYQQAVKGAVLDLAKKGLAVVQYGSGHTDYMDVAVRRAVLTGVNQTALKIQDARADEFECDLVEVSAHYGARPTHAEWQGQIYSRSGKNRKYKNFYDATGYGTGDGLGGWNCRHSFAPFFDGISVPNYSAQDLKEINSKTVEYNGQRMSLYDASQKQRANEREIRALKREQAGLEGAGQDASEVKAKIREVQARQRDLCQQTGLRRDYFRERGGKQNQQRSPNPAPKATKSALFPGSPRGTISTNGRQALTGDPITDSLGAVKKAPFAPGPAAKGTNPNFAPGTPFFYNCQRCAPVYELRRRGYDVQAKPAPTAGTTNPVIYGTECFTDTAGNPIQFDFSKGFTAADIVKVLVGAPDGARYMIYANWGNSTAHVYNAEKQFGTILYIDAQNPKAKASEYLAQGVDGLFSIVRLDDKQITTDASIIASAMEAAK